MKLLVDKKEVITCAYAKGEISRRAYWLIENPKYLIVQYLSDVQDTSNEIHIHKNEVIKKDFSLSAFIPCYSFYDFT